MENSITSIFKTSLVLCFILTVLFGFRPITEVENEPTTTYTSELNNSFVDATTLDIRMDLEGSELAYYINRGGQQKALSKVLNAHQGQAITVTYLDRRSFLNWLTNKRHICKLELANTVVYSEFNDEYGK